MYKFVEKKIADRYRSECSATLKKVQIALRKKYDINIKFTLIGSGARNLITRDGKGPFDLDYNIIILNMPDIYWKNLSKLKETIRITFNSVEENEFFTDGKDSTSVITALLYFKDTPDIEFKIDIGILSENSEGNYQRLIHDKYWNRYYWNEVPKSDEIGKKANMLKREGWWQEVREVYLNKKNNYFIRKTSFVIYVETINEVYCRRIPDKYGRYRIYNPFMN